MCKGFELYWSVSHSEIQRPGLGMAPTGVFLRRFLHASRPNFLFKNQPLITVLSRETTFIVQISNVVLPIKKPKRGAPLINMNPSCSVWDSENHEHCDKLLKVQLSSGGMQKNLKTINRFAVTV